MQNDKLVKLDNTCNETGFVIKKYENSPKVGAYIPSLMSDIDMKKGPWEQRVATVKPNILKNDNNSFKFEPITICNYYDIDQRDNAIYYVDKELGEKIRIKYEDNDIKKAFFFDEDYKMTDSLMEKVEEIEDILERHDERIKVIEDDLINKADQIKKLQTEDTNIHDQLDISVSNLQSQLNVKDSEISSLQAQLRTKDSQIANLQSQINILITNIVKLEDQLRTKDDQISTINGEINNLQGQLVYLKNLIDQMG